MRLALSLVATFAVCLTFGGVVSWHLISSSFERELRSQIDADVALLNQRTQSLKVVSVIDGIDFRLMTQDGATSNEIYLLTEPDGTIVTGNLDSWPAAEVGEADWFKTSVTVGANQQDILARSLLVDDHYYLLVGRSLAPAKAFRAMTANTLWLVGGAVLMFSIAIASLTSRHFARRTGELFSTIEAFQVGDRGSRVPVSGHDEISALGMRINDLLSTLERQIDHLDRLSGVIAHEFRSPLSRIKETLLEPGQKGDDRGLILEEIDGLLTLTTGLLEIAEHESSFERNRQVTDLSDILDKSRNLVAAMADEAGVDLNWDLAPTPMYGEPWLLVRLVTNLVENAIEATPDGKTVKVSCGLNDQNAVLSVIDQGPGVAQLTLDDMITAHTNSGDKPIPGKHGLGLKLVRAIAVRHGARITLNSPGTGSMIRVFFPQ